MLTREEAVERMREAFASDENVLLAKPMRQRGSHVILKHDDGRLTVIPVHRGEEIGRGLLSKIIKDTGLTKEEFLKLLEES